MYDYNLNDYEKKSIAEVLNSKKSARVLPSKLFLALIIILVAGWILVFIGSGEVSVSLALPVIIIVLYFTNKKNGTLDTSPDNLVAKEFETGNYSCKLCRVTGYYRLEEQNKNMVRFQTENEQVADCEFFGQQSENVVVLFFKKDEKRAFSPLH